MKCSINCVKKEAVLKRTVMIKRWRLQNVVRYVMSRDPCPHSQIVISPQSPRGKGWDVRREGPGLLQLVSGPFSAPPSSHSTALLLTPHYSLSIPWHRTTALLVFNQFNLFYDFITRDLCLITCRRRLNHSFHTCWLGEFLMAYLVEWTLETAKDSPSYQYSVCTKLCYTKRR